jgi:hypothetical protein
MEKKEYFRGIMVLEINADKIKRHPEFISGSFQLAYVGKMLK